MWYLNKIIALFDQRKSLLCVSWALLCIYLVNPVACRKCHLQLCSPASLPPSPCHSILLSWLNEQVSAWILPKGRIFWQGGLLKELYVQLWVFVVFMERGKLLYPFSSIFPLPSLQLLFFCVVFWASQTYNGAWPEGWRLMSCSAILSRLDRRGEVRVVGWKRL